MMHFPMARGVWTLLCGAGAGLYPMLSLALGLGDLQVDSCLNQPLRARIEITDVSDEEWHQLRASLASTTPSDGSVHPELLESFTVSLTEDAEHKHFLQVKSNEILTEPLFDLPIQVTGQNLQVIRSYSVLLDPPGPEDLTPSSQVAAATSSETASPAKLDSALAAPESARALVGNVITPAATAPRHHGRARSKLHRRAIAARHHASKHASSRSSYASSHAGKAGQPETNTAETPTSINTAAAAQNSTDVAARAQLESQLATLQQMLAQMQETIHTQDNEIATLTRAIAARAAKPPVRSPVVTPPPVADDGDEDSQPTTRPAIRYAIGGVVVVVLAVLAVALVKRLRRKPEYPARAVPTRDLREMPVENVVRSEPLHAFERTQPVAALATKSVLQKPAADGEKENPRTTSDRKFEPDVTRAEDSAREIDSTLEATGVEAWRTQNSMLLSDTLLSDSLVR